MMKRLNARIKKTARKGKFMVRVGGRKVTLAQGEIVHALKTALKSD